MLTLTAIKADVGSDGGHTKPSEEMILACLRSLEIAKKKGILLDYRVPFIGDDIQLLMVHRKGVVSPDIHNLAWNTFLAATDIAREEGLYGAGQDLLVDAPSGNVRGAGPGVAEIEFDENASERPVETFIVFAGDKCGPGAFNFPLWAGFTSPYFNSGLLLPTMKKGFVFTIIDMDNTDGDRVIELKVAERHLDVASLLRDENRYGVLSVRSCAYPDQIIVSVSAHRLHTILEKHTGKKTYSGKDDPVMIWRTQRIFPAPEEILMPFTTAHFVAGGARGSHHMPLMPVPINTPVTGPYCLPIVSAVGYSVTKKGILSAGIDFFDNPAWDYVRTEAQKKALMMRAQGFVGSAMVPTPELEYGSMRDALETLDKEFVVR
ncbi:MAG: fructose 1,6-bisphosphatase [bacterium]